MKRDNIPSSWRLADLLTAQEAAAIIAGHDPNHVRYEDERPAYFEMPSGFTESDGIEDVQAAFASITNSIIGGNLEANIRHNASARGMGEVAEDSERFSGVAPDWSRTTIRVKDLNTWLRSRGYPPLFSGEMGPLGPWPWGAYTTRRLDLVAEVVCQFWSTYDRDQPATAPTNDSVISWLMENRHVSRREAEAIAMVCRADDAPTGKR